VLLAALMVVLRNGVVVVAALLTAAAAPCMAQVVAVMVGNIFAVNLRLEAAETGIPLAIMESQLLRVKGNLAHLE
jgi:hypothetical protein